MTSQGDNADPPEAAGSGVSRRLRGHPWWTLIAVALGVMMTDLNMTIVAVANPVLQRDLGASLTDVQWITNAYLLALAISLIPAGRLGDRFGHRTIFLVGVAGFAVTAALIAVSGHMWVMIALRVLQGVSGALIMPSGLSLLRATFPADRLTMAIGVVILALGLAVLKAHRAEKATRTFDVAGIALLSAAMFCLLWPLVNAEALRRGEAGTWAFLGASAVLLALFVLVERRAAEPLLPRRLFASGSLLAGVVLVTLMAFALVGGLFFMTFYLQNIQGLGAGESGLRLLPLTGMMIVAAPLAGRLITAVGARVPMVVGMLFTATALVGVANLDAGSSTVVTLGWFALLGLGMAPVIVGATGVIVGNAPIELAGVASGLHQSALQLGGSLGTAVLSGVMAARVSTALPERWADAGLEPLEDDELRETAEVVSVGAAPVPEGASAQLTDQIAAVAQATFLDGMTTAFLVAAGVALVGACVALSVRSGTTSEADLTHSR
ncbi:MFS transporter [Nocardiopsis sp. FR26]|uniref:MFS transporter n=1 Tax=Nocardiopsis sp. FR26 TaxID=2605987 RepID=UPI00135C01BB|nr:MFS transporter [Nocardiopsis sp. FR26]